MADAKAIDSVPRKATNVAIKRDNKKYTGTWKLPSNATSTSRGDRTEGQQIQWCYASYKSVKDAKGKVTWKKGGSGDITDRLNRGVNTTSSTLNLAAKTGIKVKRKNFYPCNSGKKKPTYKYQYVTAKWYKQHKNDKRYKFKKAKKKNSKGYQWYIVVNKKRKYYSDADHKKMKDEKKYTFVKIEDLIKALPAAAKRTKAQKSKAKKWNKQIKAGKMYRAQSVKGSKAIKHGKCYSISLNVYGTNSKGTGDAATYEYKFAKPAKPTVTLTFNDDKMQFEAKITSTNKDKHERYDTQFTYTIDTIHPKDEDGEEWIDEDEKKTVTFKGKEKSWSHQIKIAQLPIGTAIKCTIDAVARGMAGDTKIDKPVTYTFKHADKPVINTIRAVVNYKGKDILINDGLTAEEYGGQVLVTLENFIGDKHTTVGLERAVVDDPSGTEFDKVSELRLLDSQWDEVCSFVGEVQVLGEPLADVISKLTGRKNGVPYGQRVWYRVYAERDKQKRYSDPKQAKMFWRPTPSFADEKLTFLDAIPGEDGESVTLYLTWDKSKEETGWTEDGVTYAATVTAKDDSNEISWSDKEYAWISNKKPETFDMTWRSLKSKRNDSDKAKAEFKEFKALLDSEEKLLQCYGKVVIGGLTEGTPYWFKGRRHLQMDDIDSYSDEYYEAPNNPITPVSKPTAVYLNVPETFIYGKDLMVSWNFSTDKDAKNATMSDRKSGALNVGSVSDTVQKAWALYARYQTPAFWYRDYQLTSIGFPIWTPGKQAGTGLGAYVALEATISESSEMFIYTVTDIRLWLGYSGVAGNARTVSLFNEVDGLGSVLDLSFQIGNHDPVSWTYEVEGLTARKQLNSLMASDDIENADDTSDEESLISSEASSADLTFSIPKIDEDQPLSVTFTISGRLSYSESSLVGASAILDDWNVSQRLGGLTVSALGSTKGANGTTGNTTRYVTIEKGLVAAGGTDPNNPDASDSYSIDYDQLFGHSVVKTVVNGRETLYDGPSVASGSTFELMVSVSTGGEYADSEYETVKVEYNPTCDAYIDSTITDLPISFVYFTDDPKASAIATIRSKGMVRQTPVGEEYQADGDYIWSGTLHSTELLGSASLESDSTIVLNKAERFPYAQTVMLDSDLDFWDGCEYTLEVRATNDDNDLSSETVEVNFAIDWTNKASAPSEYSTVEVHESETDVSEFYTKLVPKLPESVVANTGDTVDIYRVTPDGAHLLAEGVDYEESVYDPYPAFSKLKRFDTSLNREVAMVTRYIFCTHLYNGDLEWCERTYAITKWHGLRFDWGDGEYLELPYNISLSDNFEKNSEVRTHIDGTRNLYSNGSVKRTAGLSAEMIKLMEPEKVEQLRKLAQYTGPVLVRAHDGTEYAANVNVTGIDTNYNSLTIPVSIDTEEIDMVSEFTAVKQIKGTVTA